jgi:hypothetical protein
VIDDLLPDLPVDDVSLDLYWTALHPGPAAERSSLHDLLDMMSRLAGSDPDAAADVIDDHTVELRDPQYHPNDLISALIVEIRRLRSAAPEDQ